MLVLGREAGESVNLILPSGETIKVQVVKLKGGWVRLGIDAPKEVKILRGELELIEGEVKA